MQAHLEMTAANEASSKLIGGEKLKRTEEELTCQVATLAKQLQATAGSLDTFEATVQNFEADARAMKEILQACMSKLGQSEAALKDQQTETLALQWELKQRSDNLQKAEAALGAMDRQMKLVAEHWQAVANEVTENMSPSKNISPTSQQVSNSCVP
jgi:chromosome segregation ATPase